MDRENDPLLKILQIERHFFLLLPVGSILLFHVLVKVCSK